MPGPADILRSSRVGVLMAGERVFPTRFVIDAAGRLIAPVDHECLQAPDHVLFVPEESANALQLLVALEDLGNDPPLADRWRAYHGAPRLPLWAALTIESGRLGAEVVGGEALTLTNPLAGIEPAICKRVNSARAALRAATLRDAGVDVPEPLCVGADPYGLDVRARFGIVRVPFPRPAAGAESAAAAVDELLDGRDYPAP